MAWSGIRGKENGAINISGPNSLGHGLPLSMGRATLFGVSRLVSPRTLISSTDAKGQLMGMTPAGFLPALFPFLTKDYLKHHS